MDDGLPWKKQVQSVRSWKGYRTMACISYYVAQSPMQNNKCRVKRKAKLEDSREIERNESNSASSKMCDEECFTVLE